MSAIAAGQTTGTLFRLLGPYQVLRGKRDLSLLFGGQVVSSLGDWLYITALVILAYDLTGSAAVPALLTFVRLLPYALFLPLAGVLADRFNRKVLMIAADLGRGLCMLGLLFVTSRATLAIAHPLVFVATCLFSLFRPALKASIPAIVGDDEELVQANMLMGQIDGISFVLGPSLAGVLALLGHLQVAFAINAITYLVSAGTLSLVRVPPHQARNRSAEQDGWLAEMLAGFTLLFRENKGVLAAVTLTTAACYLFSGAAWALTVVLAETTWHLGSQGAGFLNTAYGAGGLAGGFLMGVAISKLRVGTGFIGMAALCILSSVLFGLSPGGIWPFIFMAAYGAGEVLHQAFSTTILQTATPQAMLGRVFGAFEAGAISAMLVGTLVMGPLVALAGPRAASIILALAGLVGFLVCLPRLRLLDSTLGVRAFLRRVPVLATLSRTMLDDLAARLRMETVADGAAIVRQGERGETFYLIKSGEVEVRAVREDGHEVHLATLGPADYFGEIALLRDVPRTATVTARGPVEVYSLSRAAFDDLVARAADVHATVSDTGEARYYETQTVLLGRL